MHRNFFKRKSSMKKISYLVVFSFVQFTLSCGSGSSGGGGGGENTGTRGETGAGNCPATAVQAETSGCTLNINQPGNCATVGQNSEFSWIGDACHTPYYVQITGSPPSEEVYNEIQVNTTPINANAWGEPFGAKFINGLSSDDGWYHWRVCNAYGTGCSKSQAFKVQ